MLQVHMGKEFMDQPPPPLQQGPPPGLRPPPPGYYPQGQQPPPPGYHPQGQQPPPPGYYPPGQQPPPPPGPPPKKKDSFPVAIIVVVVVLIIAIPAIIAVMWLGIIGSIVEEETQDATLSIASPSVTQRVISDETHWDAEFEINKITPSLAIVTYPDVRVVVKDASGSVLIPSTRPLADDPGDYDDKADGSVDVQVWYVSTTYSTIMFAGDSFKLTGMTDDYEGATVEFFQSGKRMGSVRLPTDFP